jgi:hypothetical protein
VSWRVDDSDVRRVLLNTLRDRHHLTLLAVDVLDLCDGAAPVLTCRTRRSLNRRSSVRRSWMRLLAGTPCCHAAAGRWTWMRLCRSSVQLPRLASSPCDGPAAVSACVARHCRGQRLSVRRSLMVVPACRQPGPLTTHARCLSTSCRRSYQSTLTSVSCRRCVDSKLVNVAQSSCRGCGPPCSRRTFASATSPRRQSTTSTVNVTRCTAQCRGDDGETRR